MLDLPTHITSAHTAHLILNKESLIQSQFCLQAEGGNVSPASLHSDAAENGECGMPRS